MTKKNTKKSNNQAKVINLADAVTKKSMSEVLKENEELKLERKTICEMAARTILHALDCKDHYTFGHSMRVAWFSVTLGKELGLSNEELYELEMAALFHDIGKIGVPDAVLLKPSRLTEDEFVTMKSHPEKSFEILEGFTHFEDVARYAKHHHERYDGRGYPDGLKGEDIPLFSRIILIADTFDAMTSSRPYRKGLDYEIAFSELEEFSGSQFDPLLAKAFVKAMRRDKKEQTKTFTLSIIEGEFDKVAA